MFGDNILDRVVDKTIMKCKQQGVYTDRTEVESVIKHYIDRIQYLFELHKNGIVSVGFIEVIGFGKFGTADGFREYRRKRRNNKLNRKNILNETEDEA